MHANAHQHDTLELQWRHNGGDGVSNHQPHDCIPNRLFGRRSKKTSKLRVNGLCEGNSPVTSDFTTQRASNTEKVPIWWRHHGHNHVGIAVVDGCESASHRELWAIITYFFMLWSMRNCKRRCWVQLTADAKRLKSYQCVHLTIISKYS